MDREVMHLRDSLIPRYSELVYYGYWYSPEREMLQTMIDEAAKGVTGTARLKLYKGNCDVVGRKSDKSLYHPDFATFEEDVVYDQKDEEGLIKHGVVEGENIFEIEGSIFSNLKKTSIIHKLNSIKLMAPCEPSKVIAIGLNY